MVQLAQGEGLAQDHGSLVEVGEDRPRHGQGFRHLLQSQPGAHARPGLHPLGVGAGELQGNGEVLHGRARHPDHAELASTLERMRSERLERARAICERLLEHAPALTLDDVLAGMPENASAEDLQTAVYEIGKPPVHVKSPRIFDATREAAGPR